MSRYLTGKENARNKAIEYQIWSMDKELSYGELMEFNSYFEKLGKRYGLLTEFKENGIC